MGKVDTIMASHVAVCSSLCSGAVVLEAGLACCCFFAKDLECVWVEDRENRHRQGIARREYCLLKVCWHSGGCPGAQHWENLP